MKNVFLIDLENVYRFLNQGTRLTEEDRIIVFHATALKEELPETVTDLMKQSGAGYEVVKLHVHNKNSMDINICMYMAELLGKGEVDVQYYVISNDTGYDEAISFLKTLENHAKISRIPIIDYAVSKDKGEEEIRAILQDDFNKVCVKEAVKAYRKATSTENYHTLIMKALPKDFHRIYKATVGILKKELKNHTNSSCS